MHLTCKNKRVILTHCINSTGPLKPKGGLLDFWNLSANVLLWDLQFEPGEIIWGLKFRGPKCAICGLKFGVGEIIRSLRSVRYVIVQAISQYQGFCEAGQLIIWGL